MSARMDQWKRRLGRLVDGVARWLGRAGFGGMSEQARRQLSIILLASLALHLLALVAFGSVVVMRSLRGERTVFVAPPPMKTFQPRQLEHKVKVQQRQRSSSRPAMTPRMVSITPSEFALPEIKVNPKAIKTSFQPKFQQVSGVGFGAGMGTGYGLGGFGLGVAQFDFFGIRARGDRIALLVDVSESMTEEERGGEKGFLRVKDKLAALLDALNEQALFNVVAFADAAQTFQPAMVIANKQNKAAAKSFLQPFNVNGRYGLKRGNVDPSGSGLPALGGTTRLDLALTAAFQQGADTILVISDGLPRVGKNPTPDQIATWNLTLEQWKRESAAAMESYNAAVQQYNKAMADAQYDEEKVWVPPRPRKEGQRAVEGHYELRRVPRAGVHRPVAPKPPQMPDDMKWWTLEDFLKHFGILQAEYYGKKGRKPPVVHCIGYGIDKQGGDFLRDFSQAYKGQYRRVGS
jgi:hypothetical protein